MYNDGNPKSAVCKVHLITSVIQRFSNLQDTIISYMIVGNKLTLLGDMHSNFLIGELPWQPQTCDDNYIDRIILYNTNSRELQ